MPVEGRFWRPQATNMVVEVFAHPRVDADGM